MSLQATAIGFLHSLSGPEAAAVLLIENAAIVILALVAGSWMVSAHADRRCAPPPDPLDRREVTLTVTTLLINTAVTWVGWWGWKHGLIHFREDLGWGVLLDVVVLTLAMDAAMYALHRVAHLPWLYEWLHRPHHAYERPRPLTLFVLHPFEAAGFGGLWLTLIMLYPASWLGMSIYLVLNVLFGVVGHLGVEPFPRRWLSWPVMGSISTSTFHAQHHLAPHANFGFYTTFWDRCFGTLDVGYDHRFTTAAAGDRPAA